MSEEAGAAPPPLEVPQPADATRRGRLADLASNLRAIPRLMMLRAHGVERLRDGAAQYVALAVIGLVMGLAFDFEGVGWQGGRWNAAAWPAVSFWIPACLLAAWLLAQLVDRARAGMFAVAALSLSLAAAALSYLLAIAADFSSPIDGAYERLSWIPTAWAALAFAVAAGRIAGGCTRARRTLVAFLAPVLFVLPQSSVDPTTRLWVPASSLDQDTDVAADAPQAEATLYNQSDLLDDALDSLAPAQVGLTELFTISFGGDGGQDVFLSEAVNADAVMSEAFDSGGHNIVLANSVAHAQERPFATVSALQRSLATVADRMNGDEDILALFITSHGTADHHLVVSLPPYAFEDLTPQLLKSLLDESAIRYRVIIISACYAGGFMDALAGRDTMVIAAAAGDRTSFGCRDGAQWTDFGRAYFGEALAQTASFEGAFRIASRRIAEREHEEGVAPSLPQIWVGPGIREQLQRLETRRGGRILFASSPHPVRG